MPLPVAFDYVAWLEDPELPEEDEDHEWCAVFIVIADSSESAAAWGDTIMRDYCSQSNDLFLHSSVEPHVCAMPITAGDKHACPNFPALSLPGYAAYAMRVVMDGEPPTAEYMGW